MVLQPKHELDDFDDKGGLAFLKKPAKVLLYLKTKLMWANEKGVKLILLPELAVPNEILPEVAALATQLGLVIVAGSDYYPTEKGYISKCPIILNGETFFTEKIKPSPFEKTATSGEGLIAGTTSYVFKNTIIGDFGVLICSDFLNNNLKIQMYEQNIDVLCVIACQGKSDTYHTRMHNECEESENGVYILYSNLLLPGYGDGHSALFGVIDKHYCGRLVEKGYTDAQYSTKLVDIGAHESYFIADVCLKQKKPFINRTVDSRPNVIIEACSGFEESDVVSSSDGDELNYVSQTIESRTEQLSLNSIIINNVLFDRYTSEVDKYYIATERDEVVGDTLFVTSLWLSGPSGCGKTCTIERSFQTKQLDYYYVSLAPCLHCSVEDMFRSIYYDLGGDSDQQLNTIKDIVRGIKYRLLSRCNDVVQYVYIEELPLDADEEFDRFLEILAVIMIECSDASPSNGIKFVLSSVINPEKHVKPYHHKIHEKIKFIHITHLDINDINKLIEIIVQELKLPLSSDEQLLVSEMSAGSPRFVKKFVRNYISLSSRAEWSFDSILNETRRELSYAH